MADRYLDAAQVARTLDVSRGHVGELATSGIDFPAATVGTRGYRLWSRESIRAWVSSHASDGPTYKTPEVPVAEPRLHGTPERVTRELQEVLELAFAEALSLNHHWVGSDHIALAFLRPDCPGAAGPVLRSFGMALEDARNAWVDSMGDSYDPHDLKLAVPPATRFPFERAKLVALDLRDEHVSSEHLLIDLVEESTTPLSDRQLAERVLTPRVLSTPDLLWRVRSSKSASWVLRMFLKPRGIDANAVRQRVIALTEDPARTFQPLPPATPPARTSRWAGAEPELALSPLGHHPDRRRPWGSGVFTDADGAPIMQGSALRQYLIDRDGYPVLTTDGKPVHIVIDERGDPALDEDGNGQLAVIDVPPGSEARAYHLEDWR